MSKFEQLLSKVAPRLAYERAIARHNLDIVNNAATYRGGARGRITGDPVSSTMSEDDANAWTYDKMRDSAMQLYRDDPMCRSIVDVSSTYLGESKAIALTSDPAWNKQAEEFFNSYWWNQADARGRNGSDFGELQCMFDRWSWIGGDMIFLLFNGQLLPYEGTQIRTPSSNRNKSIVNGIQVYQKAPWPIIAYHLRDRNDSQRIAANQCIYAGSRNWRPSMLRAVPDLHGIIDSIRDYGKIFDNVQSRIRFESMLFTVERKGAIGSLPGSRMLSADSSSGAQVEHSKADWGMRLKINGDPQKDFVLSQMQNPNSNYVQVMEYMAKYIAAGTGFPYEVVMHVYTNGSYTANRAARNDFAKAIMKRWAWRNKVLNSKTWNWRIAKAIKEGVLPPAPVAENGISEWHKVAWTLPHFPHIDEGKEVLADINQWGCGQESLADWAQTKGMTRDQLLDAHDADIKAIKERADKLEIPLSVYMGKLFAASATATETPSNGDDNDET